MNMTQNNAFLMFEFETPSEFVLYCKYFEKEINNSRVLWTIGTDYKDLCAIGYDHLKAKNYDQAAYAFNKALEFNPIGIEARFGLAEISAKTSRYKEAKNRLFAMKDYIYSGLLAGKYYRKIGYICAEEGNLNLAYACAVRGKIYDDSAEATELIEYIKKKGPVDESVATTAFLGANNIPLIPAKGNTHFEDIEIVNNAYEQIRSFRQTTNKAAYNEDILKVDGISHLAKLNDAYGKLNPDSVDAFFPKGKPQANRILKSLANIYEVNLEKCDSDVYFRILKTYEEMIYNKVLREVSDETIVNTISNEYPDLIKNINVARKALAFVMMSINNPQLSLEEDDDKALSMMADYYSYAEETKQENKNAETMYLNDPEYGLVATKPIYTTGVTASKNYVNALKTGTGDKLNWVRRGPTSAPGINGIIDIYDSYLPSGALYKTIYVNMYGSTNSSVIPRGFSR